MKNFALLTALIVFCQTAFGQFYWGSLDGKDTAINLTRRLGTSADAISIEYGTGNPTAVAVAASQGSLYLAPAATYIKLDNGSSTNWAPLLSSGAGAGTNDCLARWNGTGVFLLQDSPFCVTDAGVGTGLTDLTVGNVQLVGNTVASSNANGDIILNPNGTGGVQFPDLTANRPLRLNASGQAASGLIDLADTTNTVSGLLPIANLADGAANQVLGTNAAGNANEWKSITATANQTTITHSVGGIAVGTVQDIATTSNVQFARVDVDSLRLDGDTLSNQSLTGDVVIQADPSGGGGRAKFTNGTSSEYYIGSNNPELSQMMSYPSFEETVAELQCDNCSGFSQEVSTGVEGELYGLFHARASYGGATIDTIYVMPGTNLDDDMPATVSCWVNTARVAVTFRFSNTTDGDSDSQAVSSSGTWARYQAQGTCRAGIGEACGWKIVDNTAEAGDIDINGCSIVLGQSPINLASGQVTGTLPASKGGTGIASYTAGDILYATGATTLAKLPVASNGDFLRLSGGLPAWSTVAATGAQTIGSIDSVGKSANGAVISGTALIMQTTDATFPGILSLVAQTITGLKTFVSGIIDSTLTSGRVMIVGALGRHTDDAGFTYSTANDEATIGAIVTNSATRASGPCPPMAAAPGAASSYTNLCYRDTVLKQTFWSDGTSWVVSGVQPSFTPWSSCTATMTWVSNATLTCLKRQVGSHYEYQFKVALTGAPTAAALNITLPTGDVIDTASLLDAVGNDYTGGIAGIMDNGSPYPSGCRVRVNSSTLLVLACPNAGSLATATQLGAMNATSPITFANGDMVFARISVPIVGLTGGSSTYSIASSGASQIKWNEVANCNPSTTSGTLTDLTDTDCTYASAEKIGTTVTPTTTGEIALKKSTVRAGKYRVQFDGSLVAAGDAVCQFRLYDGTRMAGPSRQLSAAAGEAEVYSNGLGGLIEYTTDQATVEWNLQAARISGTGTCQMDARSTGNSAALSLEPVGEMITATLNDVIKTPGIGSSAKDCAADVSSAGVVSNEECTSFINGSCAVTDTSLYTCTWDSSFWATAPKCTIAAVGATVGLGVQFNAAPDTTSAVVRTHTAGATKTASAFVIRCKGQAN